MACPSVAGAAALLQSVAIAKGQPLDPETLFELLRSTAKDIGVPGHDIKTGTGLIQPLVAFRKIVPIDMPDEPEIPEPENPTADLPKKWVMWAVVGVIILILGIVAAATI